MEHPRSLPTEDKAQSAQVDRLVVALQEIREQVNRGHERHYTIANRAFEEIDDIAAIALATIKERIGV